MLAARTEDPGFRSFATLEEATAALEVGDVEGLYVLATDYPASGAAELLYRRRPPEVKLQGRFETFLSANLVGTLSPEIAARALEGPERIAVRSADGAMSRSPGGGDLILRSRWDFISFALMRPQGI